MIAATGKSTGTSLAGGNSKNDEQGEATGGKRGSFRSKWQLVTLLFLAALVVRLLYIALVRQDPLFFSTVLDAAEYQEWARDIARGDPWSGVRDQMPFYAYLNYTLHALFGDPIVPLYVLQTLAGLCTAGIVFWLGHVLFGPYPAVFGGTLFLFHPDWIVLEARPQPTVWIGLFVALGVLFLVFSDRLTRPGWEWIAGAGCWFALACAVSAHVLFVVPAVLIWFLFCTDWSAGQRVAGICLWCLPLIVTTGAVLYANHLTMTRGHGRGGLLLEGDAGSSVYAGTGPGSDGTAPARPGLRHDRIERMARKIKENHPVHKNYYYFRKTLDYVVNHPSDVLKTTLRKLYYVMTNYAVENTEPVAELKDRSWLFSVPLIPFGFFVILGGIGVGRSFWRGGTSTCLVLTILGLLIGPLLVGPTVRGRLPTVPLLSVLAGGGLLYLAISVQRLHITSLAWIFPVMIVGLVGFVPLFNVTQERSTSFLVPYWRAKVLWDQGARTEALDRLKHQSRGKVPLSSRIYLDYLHALYLFEMRSSGSKQDGDLSSPMIAGTTLLEILDREQITFPDAHVLMGRIRLANNQLEKAIEQFRKALRERPDPDTFARLGEALVRSDQYEEVLEEMKRAVKRFPDCVRCRLVRARALGLQQEWDAAINELQNVLDRRGAPTEQQVRAEAHYYLGYLYERTERFGRALRHYEQARKIGGEFQQEASNRLKDLKKRREESESRGGGGSS